MCIYIHSEEAFSDTVIDNMIKQNLPLKIGTPKSDSKPYEVTPHRDGHGIAPPLTLNEVLKQKSKLKPQKYPTRENDGKHSVYDAMCLEGNNSEHIVLQEIHKKFNGNLEEIADYVQKEHPQYCLEKNKLLKRSPKTAKSFAWQCVEGYYS
eukprot:g5460.t1